MVAREQHLTNWRSLLALDWWFTRPSRPTGEVSALNFVDLAGTGQGDGSNCLDAERADKKEKELVTAECLAINKSQLILGQVVHALVKQSKGKHVHVPYRESTLTWSVTRAPFQFSRLAWSTHPRGPSLNLPMPAPLLCWCGFSYTASFCCCFYDSCCCSSTVGLALRTCCGLVGCGCVQTG
jgi:hypothetical protein